MYLQGKKLFRIISQKQHTLPLCHCERAERVRQSPKNKNASPSRNMSLCMRKYQPQMKKNLFRIVPQKKKQIDAHTFCAKNLYGLSIFV